MGASFAALPIMAGRDAAGIKGFVFMSGFIVLLVLIHEVGHALAALAYRAKVSGILLYARGGVCFIEDTLEDRTGRILFICGGVLAQAAAFICVALAIWLLGPPTSYWMVCGAIVFLGFNPIFMLFSIVPYGRNDAAQLIQELKG